MAKQGKCVRCRIRYVWEKEVPLRILFCQICGSPLEATTRYSTLATLNIKKLNVKHVRK